MADAVPGLFYNRIHTAGALYDMVALCSAANRATSFLSLPQEWQYGLRCSSNEAAKRVT
jgi:hypothetical protein